MNNKQVIRLTESDLHRIIKESVNRILREGYNPSPEFDEIHHLGSDIERLHKTYDPSIDADVETAMGSVINYEGDDDYEPYEILYPNREAQSFVDYANRVGDRSTRRKEDMDSDFEERDRVKRSVEPYWRRELRKQYDRRRKELDGEEILNRLEKIRGK